MKEMLFNVDGMTCDHCAETVGVAIGSLAGVCDTDVVVAEGTARVQFEEAACDPRAIADAIRSAGFQVTGFGRVD